MKRRILAVRPGSRVAVESVLGDLLGDGWGAGCLTGYPQPATPAVAAVAPTVYVCDAHLTPDEAAKVEALAAADATVTLAKALAEGERPDGPRKTLREVLTEHAAKPAADPKVRP